jgi:hypothetical protein
MIYRAVHDNDSTTFVRAECPNEAHRIASQWGGEVDHLFVVEEVATNYIVWNTPWGDEVHDLIDESMV